MSLAMDFLYWVVIAAGVVAAAAAAVIIDVTSRFSEMGVSV